ncbi:unnamed protein product [Nippostrongylus brasiliensis]|uniref:BZIP domain-containing protein n=1 Tax=Nippostrongylus brasiliensis TaxID=27835 RepID=A0A0N4YNY2_NIPBR|nr:unnamed protein product [Nippostrongylus brasiliensis]
MCEEEICKNDADISSSLIIGYLKRQEKDSLRLFSHLAIDGGLLSKRMESFTHEHVFYPPTNRSELLMMNVPSYLNTRKVSANWTNQLTNEPPAKHYRSFEYKTTESKQFFSGDVYTNCCIRGAVNLHYSQVDGESVTLRMDELIDMVLTAARNVDDADGSASPSDREKRRVREKNKHAAQLYRKRRNERLSNLKNERLRLEVAKVNLKNTVKALEDEVAAYKASIARYLHI